MKLQTHGLLTFTSARSYKTNHERKVSLLKVVSFVFVFCAATAVVSSAQPTFTTLVSLDWSNGSAPAMVLTQGSDGTFYGTTELGGSQGYGTVFNLTPAGTVTTLYSFCALADCADGKQPVGGLVQARNGNYYGTTAFGGANGKGTVFEITSAGALTTLYSFCALAACADGEFPYAGLAQATNGNLYGTTAFGGVNGKGTIFEITELGALTKLHDFEGTDGYEPGELLQASSLNFYGETEVGGSSGFGTIFEITPAGAFTTVLSFNGTNGAYPTGGLIQGTNGDFYGVTSNGGSNNSSDCDGGCGTVFSLTSLGELSTLYNFCSSADCADGASPNGPLAQGTDGNFYGTTYGNFVGAPSGAGTVFKITSAGALTTLYTVCTLTDCADGDLPAAGVFQATNGVFYGTTFEGGADSDGTIFSLSVGLAPFVKAQPAFADEGTAIDIIGQGFTSSSVVKFGGVEATHVIFSGAGLLVATVPAGALTGSVTVATSGTTLTSSSEFRVTPQVLSFNPPSGPVGTQVTITGTGLTQAEGVGFGNRVPAVFKVVSDTEITATVPTGAVTGTVGVLTKGGTAISSSKFTVN